MAISIFIDHFDYKAPVDTNLARLKDLSHLAFLMRMYHKERCISLPFPLFQEYFSSLLKVGVYCNIFSRELSSRKFIFLPIDELLLQRGSPVVVAHAAVFMDDTMTWDDDSHGILGYSRGHGPYGSGLSYGGRHVAIAHGGAKRNLAELSPNFLLKVGTPDIKLQFVLVALEEHASYRLGHSVVLCSLSVHAPAGGQFVNDVHAVVGEKLQVTDSVPSACNDDVAEASFRKAVYYLHNL